ncbi:MAG: dodecin family protein [Spongiibacteraceae bacterium]|jgi:flavin-binding protein dodecin|nr:dodecin family protein [Spongiibacteraceae bacterium]
MLDHIYKSVEITGSSATSMEDAVQSAVARTAQTVHNLRWLEVTNIRAHIEDQKVAHWQVTIKLGFKLD